MSLPIEVMCSDMAAAAEGSATRRSIGEVRRLMARHLHLEHGWGIRRVAKELGMPESRVRAALGKDT